jgi:hypothetical protein
MDEAVTAAACAESCPVACAQVDLMVQQVTVVVER